MIPKIQLLIITIALTLCTQLSAAQPGTPRRQSQRSLMCMYPGPNTDGSAWAGIAADSIAWLLRSNTEIDPNARGNHLFKDAALATLLCNDMCEGRVRAFGTVTDSFTSGVTKDEAFAYRDKVQASSIPCRIRLIEDLISMKGTGKTYRCILGIAPEVKDASGMWQPLFWIYYNDMKPHLARTVAGSNGTDMWLDVFARHDFKSRVLSSADTLRYPNIVHYSVPKLR